MAGRGFGYAALLFTSVAAWLPAVGCGGSDDGQVIFLDTDAGDDGAAGTAGSAGSGVGGSSGSSGQAGAGGMPGGPCNDDDDCNHPTPHCHPLDEQCVECFTDDQCGADEECIDDRCEEVVTCQNSLDCVDAPGDRGVCDPATSECVQCVTAADCEADHDCSANECVPFQACVNSLDCDGMQVCDTDEGRCVDCITDSDCGDAEKCLGSTCRSECDSDNDCTPQGLLCDRDLGACVECVKQDDCVESAYCSEGSCLVDVCTAGTARCEGSMVLECNALGSAYEPRETCGSRQTCAAAGGMASCEDWVCTAGADECDGNTAVSCSDDGLSIDSSTTCTAQQTCVAGSCKDHVCVPSAVRCDPDDVAECAPDGLSEAVTDDCTSTEYCDDSGATPACLPQVCTPGAPLCDGNRATTCNANGSGFSPGGTVCTAQQTCVAGSCEDHLCVPNAKRCSGGNVLECSSDGLSETTFDVCPPSSEYCDAATASCQPHVCTPSQPACNGTFATTCNADGSDYTGPGTDCSPEACVGGMCVACTSQTVTTSFANNNGSDGVMFDLTSTADAVIEGFDVNLDAGTHTIEVYVVTGGGSYVGKEDNAAAWTQIATFPGIVSAGEGAPTALPKTMTQSVSAGATLGFYVTVPGTSTFNYITGTTEGALAATDGTLSIFEGIGKSHPFSETFRPRVFSGNVQYRPCP